MPSRGTASGRGGRSGRGRDRGSAGCLLWLIVFSFIFVLFVLNWGRIKATLDRTNFNEIVRNQRGVEQPAPTAPETPAPAAPSQGPAGGAAGPDAGGPVPGGETAQPPDPALPASGAGGGAGTAPGAGGTAGDLGASAKGGASPASGAEKALTAAQPPKARPATLFFVRIDDDGVIVRQDVRRLIPASGSPLTDALQALISGPDEAELRQRLVSLIPSGTRLLGVRVQGTTAFVNLSEPFMYNHYGIEGYAGQLKQIVYTATAFPTVHDVQILIEGERHDYLGGEGVYIGKPLSRNSF